MIREMEPEPEGYFSVHVEEVSEGWLYRFCFDEGPEAPENPSYPDPASRFQPDGPDGPSQVIDPSRFLWKDQDWTGTNIKGRVVYEMHIGTFTPEGTWKAAEKHLPELAEIGINLIELMPVGDFAGNFDWGYSGVDLFAPTRVYGMPDDFRSFVNRAHELGVGVILDVVYNHLGPVGNYLPRYSLDYFTDRYETDWGYAINFDGENAGPVREFFISNAVYWIREFHLDGMRIDATQAIFDASSDPILTRIIHEARLSAVGRSLIFIAENEPQQAVMIRDPEAGGIGFDAVWNDDFHHSAAVALTGRNEGYYANHLGAPQELISAAKWGFLYQGQYYHWQQQARGSRTMGFDPAAFVIYIQNHDQIANSAWGERIHLKTDPGKLRAMVVFFLLLPQTPMLFQGQEFRASSPFCFFSDHKKDLAVKVRKGRIEFLSQFDNLKDPGIQEKIADPSDPAMFRKCKLDHTKSNETDIHRSLYRDLLRIRREDPVFREQRSDWLHGAVIGPDAFVLRFFGEKNGDRLILVNLGRSFTLIPAPEPLLGPPVDSQWDILLSSEDAAYGGNGTPDLKTNENWHIEGHAAVVLAPKKTVRLR